MVKTPVMGVPDVQKASTSHVERQNRTMRMHIRRMTRRADAFSKKLENHVAATALHFAYYNLVRVHEAGEAAPGCWDAASAVRRLAKFTTRAAQIVSIPSTPILETSPIHDLTLRAEQ